jgi:hypothetical protein
MIKNNSIIDFPITIKIYPIYTQTILYYILLLNIDNKSFSTDFKDRFLEFNSTNSLIVTPDNIFYTDRCILNCIENMHLRHLIVTKDI